MLAFVTTGVQRMVVIFYSCAKEVCAGSNEERAIFISSMNGFQYTVAEWLPIVTFPQTMVLTFRYDFLATWRLVLAALIGAMVIQLLAFRDKRRQ